MNCKDKTDNAKRHATGSSVNNRANIARKDVAGLRLASSILPLSVSEEILSFLPFESLGLLNATSKADAHTVGCYLSKIKTINIPPLQSKTQCRDWMSAFRAL